LGEKESLCKSQTNGDNDKIEFCFSQNKIKKAFPSTSQFLKTKKNIKLTLVSYHLLLENTLPVFQMKNLQIFIDELVVYVRSSK